MMEINGPFFVYVENSLRRTMESCGVSVKPGGQKVIACLVMEDVCIRGACWTEVTLDLTAMDDPT